MTTGALQGAAGEIFVRRGADRDFSSRFEESNPRTWLENRGKSESNPAKTRANSLDSTSKRREGAEVIQVRVGLSVVMKMG